EEPIGDETERLLRRLRVQHDVLWITLRDADPVLETVGAGSARADVDTGWTVPDFIQGDAAVVAELAAQRSAAAAHRDRLLDGLEISRTELAAQADAVPALLQMLHRRSRVRSR